MEKWMCAHFFIIKPGRNNAAYRLPYGIQAPYNVTVYSVILNFSLMENIFTNFPTTFVLLLDFRKATDEASHYSVFHLQEPTALEIVSVGMRSVLASLDSLPLFYLHSEIQLTLSSDLRALCQPIAAEHTLNNEIAPPSSETDGEVARALGQWKKALYAFHPEEGLIARYRLSRVMKGASTILMMMVHFPTGQSDDANLYFLAWLYFIDRGVSGRASAFNQTGTGQDENRLGEALWVRITFME
ncbi:hypothetical protein ACJX0J_002301, partial (mitochondrion) [Zea mays]